MLRKKYLIGLGCSWTQGEGGYPTHVWDRYKGRVQLKIGHDYHLRKHELENSWVNVLCRDYFTDYTSVNLGVRGVGNRAAVNQLYFCDRVDFTDSTGIILLMSTGFARQDIFSPNARENQDELDFYSNEDFKHYKWVLANNVLVRDINFSWNDTVLACEFALNLLHLQDFCERYRYKLIFANAFEPIEFKDYLKKYTGSLYSKINWDSYFHQNTDYVSLMQHLIRLDNLIPEANYFNGKYIPFYNSKNYPTKYLTNCNGAHPTIEGYKEIALELSKFIKNYI